MQTTWLRSFIRLFAPAQPIPAVHRSTFVNLFMDMAWIGVLSGSTITFLSVYAARLGATSTQIGFISAAPAVINLIFAIPAAGWTRGRPLGAAAFWSSALARIFYLPLCFLPYFFKPAQEIWAIIVIILVMNVPLSLLNVSFNAMMIESVPFEWRAYVVGLRNGLLSIITVIVTLVSGQILNHVPFPLGYQIVFGMGFLGAAMSSLHLFLLREKGAPLPGSARTAAGWFPRFERTAGNLKYFRILFLLFCFHTTQWLVIPVVPLYSVNFLKLTDVQISLGNSMFNLIVFFGSFALARVSGRFGNHRATAFCAMGMAIFPVILSFSRGFGLYMTAQFVGGVVWSILMGALFNYLAENVPEENRASGISLYIFVSNGSILIGSLLGPMICDQAGYPVALLAFGGLRLLSGLAILRWG
ncbi:MAG TPA: MFS transporter [Anaerolinea sp.]|nr:MFS transporter [Anaerolinea sp.]